MSKVSFTKRQEYYSDTESESDYESDIEQSQSRMIKSHNRPNQISAPATNQKKFMIFMIAIFVILAVAGGTFGILVCTGVIKFGKDSETDESQGNTANKEGKELQGNAEEHKKGGDKSGTEHMTDGVPQKAGKDGKKPQTESAGTEKAGLAKTEAIDRDAVMKKTHRNSRINMVIGVVVFAIVFTTLALFVRVFFFPDTDNNLTPDGTFGRTYMDEAISRQRDLQHQLEQQQTNAPAKEAAQAAAQTVAQPEPIKLYNADSQHVMTLTKV